MPELYLCNNDARWKSPLRRLSCVRMTKGYSIVYYFRCTPMCAGCFYLLTHRSHGRTPLQQTRKTSAHLVELPTKRQLLQGGGPLRASYGLIERPSERQPLEPGGPNGPLCVDTLVKCLAEGEAFKTGWPFHLEHQHKKINKETCGAILCGLLLSNPILHLGSHPNRLCL